MPDHTLAVVPCVLCGHPVAHYDPSVAGSRVGGLCMRASCRTDPRNGQRRYVYTFERIVQSPHGIPNGLERYPEPAEAVSALSEP